MDRLISEQASESMTNEEAIEILEDCKRFSETADGVKYPRYYALEKAIKALEQEPKWIPVSEQPKNKMICIVYGKMHFIPDHVDEKDWYYDYTIGYYKPKYGWSIRGNMSDSDVMAYMPLPSPYKGE